MTLIEATDPRKFELQYRCRSVGHHWDTFVPVDFAYTSLWRRANHFRCNNCGTCRHDALDVRGELLTRKYDYPDEYRMSVDDRPTSDELRLWMMKRNRALGMAPKLPRSRAAS